MNKIKTTEKDSLYDNLQKKDTLELISDINREDKKISKYVKKNKKDIKKLIDAVIKSLKDNGRIFYIGAGTSGRLGVLDASECPPTFGVNKNTFIGIIAGGKKALHSSVENAEDSKNQAWKDLKKHKVSKKDIVIGLSASGSTPYVKNGLKKCIKNRIKTGSICCNKNSNISKYSNFAIEVEVGPEFVTGSTRMKSGTAQKMILNMISTISMIKLKKIKGNKMINLKINNNKLFDRAVRIVVKEFNIDEKQAIELLKEKKSIQKVIKHLHK